MAFKGWICSTYTLNVITVVFFTAGKNFNKQELEFENEYVSPVPMFNANMTGEA